MLQQQVTPILQSHFKCDFFIFHHKLPLKESVINIKPLSYDELGQNNITYLVILFLKLYVKTHFFTLPLTNFTKIVISQKNTENLSDIEYKEI